MTHLEKLKQLCLAGDSRYDTETNFRRAFNPATALALVDRIEKLRDALNKIDEPFKYHHWEEDSYTRAACFQFVACEALRADDALDSNTPKEKF